MLDDVQKKRVRGPGPMSESEHLFSCSLTCSFILHHLLGSCSVSCAKDTARSKTNITSGLMNLNLQSIHMVKE